MQKKVFRMNRLGAVTVVTLGNVKEMKEPVTAELGKCLRRFALPVV